MRQKSVEKPVFYKRLIIMGLYLFASMIVILGSFFTTYSIMHQVSIPILNNSVPAAILGALVIYFGIKNIVMVYRFESTFYEESARFSWRNFRRQGKRIKNKN